MSDDGQSNILLGPDNPWPGLNQFCEDHDRYFRGRDEEKAALFRLVKSETLTILFGKSGLGKSSLLQAGLFPVLRQAGYFPPISTFATRIQRRTHRRLSRKSTLPCARRASPAKSRRLKYSTRRRSGRISIAPARLFGMSATAL